MDLFLFKQETCNKFNPNSKVFYKVNPKLKLSGFSLSNTESEEQKALCRNLPVHF